MNRIVLATMLALSLGAGSANALRLADTAVVIPIIGRFPGANGTQWQTDVFIANPYSPVANVTATFYVAGAPPISKVITVGPFSDASLKDIVLNTYGSSDAAGQLILRCSTSIEARARIYNTANPAGEVGQNVPGLGLSTLRNEAFIYGLSTTVGYRVNIGVANPDDATAAIVTVRVRDMNNTLLYSQGIILQPHETRQFNDLVAAFGISPQEGVQVEFDAVGSSVIYGYASEVRNDSGDAIFMFGTSPNVFGTGPN